MDAFEAFRLGKGNKKRKTTRSATGTVSPRVADAARAAEAGFGFPRGRPGQPPRRPATAPRRSRRHGVGETEPPARRDPPVARRGRSPTRRASPSPPAARRVPEPVRDRPGPFGRRRHGPLPGRPTGAGCLTRAAAGVPPTPRTARSMLRGRGLRRRPAGSPAGAAADVAARTPAATTAAAATRDSRGRAQRFAERTPKGQRRRARLSRGSRKRSRARRSAPRAPARRKRAPKPPVVEPEPSASARRGGCLGGARFSSAETSWRPRGVSSQRRARPTTSRTRSRGVRRDRRVRRARIRARREARRGDVAVLPPGFRRPDFAAGDRAGACSRAGGRGRAARAPRGGFGGGRMDGGRGPHPLQAQREGFVARGAAQVGNHPGRRPGAQDGRRPDPAPAPAPTASPSLCAAVSRARARASPALDPPKSLPGDEEQTRPAKRRLVDARAERARASGPSGGDSLFRSAGTRTRTGQTTDGSAREAAAQHATTRKERAEMEFAALLKQVREEMQAQVDTFEVTSSARDAAAARSRTG